MIGTAECVENLTKEQKIAFVQAFVRLASADGNFDDDEKAYIADLAKSYGLTEKDKDSVLKVKNDKELLKSVAKIKDRRAALELIKELCILAHADDSLSKEETVLIGEIGQAMGVELEKIEQISNWVIDRFIWLEEEKIIFEEVV